MTAEQFLSHVTQVAFVVICITAIVQAIRRPRAATFHTAAFFGLATAIIVMSWIADVSGRELPESAGLTAAAMLVCMPYVLLMLADDFAGVPRRMLLTYGFMLIAVVVSLYVVPRPFPTWYSLVVVAYLVVVLIHSTVRFARAAGEASGVSRRRMQAVATGGGLFALIFVFSGLSAAVPDQRGTWAGMSSVASFACGIAYFAGFCPPQFIRQAWQAPDLLRFFGVSALIPRESLVGLTRVLEDHVQLMLGTQHVIISIWDDPQQRLYAPRAHEPEPPTANPESTVAYQAFRAQKAMFVEHAGSFDPANRDTYREWNASTIMAAPITANERRFGMLLVFGDRPPLFADDDLELVQIMARQIAILLRDFELTSEITAYHAHLEAARLKEDFLAAAAHDLKTPLTALVAQSQLLQRRALRDPRQPADLEGIGRIVNETARMRMVVDDLLDAARGDQLGFIGRLEPVELSALVADVLANNTAGRTINLQCTPVTIQADTERIRQVVRNLRDNAVKYSPHGGDIDVTLAVDDHDAILTFKDHGIGIAPDDLKLIFERFRRAPSVRHGSMTGLGLGLYFCKRIVEEHGGRIAVQSVLGHGSEFEVRLPLTAEPRTPEPRAATLATAASAYSRSSNTAVTSTRSET